jgi:hypothetical protein
MLEPGPRFFGNSSGNGRSSHRMASIDRSRGSRGKLPSAAFITRALSPGHMDPRQDTNFSQAVRYLVAGRSGYRCAIPGCGRLTIGPGPIGNVENSGFCAHILSASSAGPRGQRGTSLEYLASADNAIWTCGTHASLIDKSSGLRYPPETLHGFRELHEARTALEQGNMAPQASWIEHFHIATSPIFVENASFRLGKVTLVSGANGKGKTVLCRAMAGFGDPLLFEEWTRVGGQPDLDVSMQCLTVNGSSLQRALIQQNGRVTYYVNDRRVPVFPLPLRTIYLKTYFPADSRDPQPDHLSVIGDRLGLPASIVLNLLEALASRPDDRVLAVRTEDAGDRTLIYADIRGTIPGLPFHRLSSSEQTTLLLRLIAIYADTLASAAPVLVFLDGGVTSLDGQNLRECLEFFASKSRFQTVAMLVPHEGLPVDVPGVDYLRLAGNDGNVQIELGIASGPPWR